MGIVSTTFTWRMFNNLLYRQRVTVTLGHIQVLIKN